MLTCTQIAVGVLAKSQGLIADGIHSLSDLVADFVVLFAGHQAKKGADADHPYGHQRFETAASLVCWRRPQSEPPRRPFGEPPAEAPKAAGLRLYRQCD